MGAFNVEFDIGDRQGQRWTKVDALVDLGSTYTWIPRDVLAELGVVAQFQREFETEDGRVVTRDMAVTMARLDGQALPTQVVFAGETDSSLLGVVTLEEFSLDVDPVDRRLTHVRGFA